MKLNILIFFALFLFSCSGTRKTQVTEPENTQVSADRIAATNFIIDGKRAEIQGNFSEALNNYQMCLSRDPKNHTACFLLSQLYARKDINQAIYFAKKACELNPNEKEYKINLLNLYKYDKRFTEAAQLLENLIQLEPRKKELYFDLANMYIYQADYKKALQVYNKTEAEFGFEPGIILQKKQIYLNQKNYEKAAQEIEKLIKNQTENTEYYGMAADVYQAMGQKEKAFEYYNKILKINPKDGKVHLALADFYALKKDSVQQFNELKLAFESEELEVDMKIEYLLKFFNATPNEKNNLQLTNLLEILTKTHPKSPKALAMKADFLNRDGKYPQAREAFLDVISLDSSKYIIWEQLVLIDRELGNYAQLEFDSRRAIALFPQYSLLYYLNAFAHYKMSNFAAAEESIETGKEYCYSPANQSDFRVLSAMLKMEERKFDLAERYLADAEKISPESSAYLRERGNLMIRKGIFGDESLNLFILACNRHPLDVENRLALTNYYIQTKDYQKAFENVLKAESISPHRPEIYDMKGDISFNMGNLKDAISSWKIAIEKGSANSTNILKKIQSNE